MRSVRWQRLSPAFVLALTLAALLLACGGAADPSGGAGGGNTGFSTEVFTNQVPVAADPKGGLKWDRAVYEAKAGDVTFVVTNASPIAHNFVVLGNGVRATSKNFRTQSPQFLSLRDLAPGEYQIVCTVPGHREGGMIARLIVT